jgi:hypothetical protein
MPVRTRIRKQSLLEDPSLGEREREPLRESDARPARSHFRAHGWDEHQDVYGFVRAD